MHTVQMFATPNATPRNDKEGRNAMLDFALQQCGQPGLYLEFGVHQGGSINHISKQLPEGKIIHGFDSFEGLPDKWLFGRGAGHFSTGGQLPPVGDNVRLYKGWFSDTLPGFLAENPEPFSFVHIDCDLYVSTKQILDLAGDRLKAGTIIVFDEYFNYPGWEQHEYRAFKEFIAVTNRSYEYIGCAPRHFSVAVRLGDSGC
ncbi:MAG: class I SAM-dependent methyltransferase [Verrucomicrobia bacterium]|nr:class I SAM-dependent methyltransferase [Verrucomicrobiota bacterium]